MAHSCPTCDSLCHCGGDIDDIQLNGTEEEMNCTHCIEDDDGYEEDDDWPEDDGVSDEEKEDNRKAFEAEMKNWPEPPASDGVNDNSGLPF